MGRENVIITMVVSLPYDPQALFDVWSPIWGFVQSFTIVYGITIHQANLFLNALYCGFQTFGRNFKEGLFDRRS